LADSKISALTAVSLPIVDTDVGTLVRSGGNYKYDHSALKTFIGTATKSFLVPAAAIRPSATGGCQAIDIAATSANHPDRAVLWFDATTAEYAQFAAVMPKNWNRGTVTAKFTWVHKATTTNFGVKWGIQAVAVSDGDTIDVAFGTAQEVADTGGTTDTQYVTAATSAMTIAGTPAAEDVVFFRVYRLPSDALDTLAVDAGLEFVKIYYTTTTTDEA